MTPKKAWYTKLFLLGVLTLALILDIWWAANEVAGDTISEVTKAYSWRWATIPLAYGVITGHLFWSAMGEIAWKKARFRALFPLGAVSVVLDFLDYYDMMPAIPLALGIVLGRVLWPQAVSRRAIFIWKDGP